MFPKSYLLSTGSLTFCNKLDTNKLLNIKFTESVIFNT